MDGTIVGGTITGGGVQFNSGTLSGVSYIGALDLSRNGSDVIINNGITLSPTNGSSPGAVLVTGNSSYLDFTGSQTLSNAGVTLGASGQFGLASLRAVGVGTSLTLDQSVTITTVGGAALYAMPGDTIDNAGTITVAAAYSGLGIAGSFINQGVINVSNRDSLFVGSMSGNGTVNLSGGAVASVTGSVGSGEVVNFSDHSGRLNLNQPSGFAGSVQGFRDGDAIDLLGIGAAA